MFNFKFWAKFVPGRTFYWHFIEIYVEKKWILEQFLQKIVPNKWFSILFCVTNVCGLANEKYPVPSSILYNLRQKTHFLLQLGFFSMVIAFPKVIQTIILVLHYVKFNQYFPTKTCLSEIFHCYPCDVIKRKVIGCCIWSNVQSLIIYWSV